MRFIIMVLSYRFSFLFHNAFPPLLHDGPPDHLLANLPASVGADRRRRGAIAETLGRA